MQSRYADIQETFIRKALGMGYSPKPYTDKTFYVGFFILVDPDIAHQVAFDTGVLCTISHKRDGAAIFPNACISSVELRNLSSKYRLERPNNEP